MLCRKTVRKDSNINLNSTYRCVFKVSWFSELILIFQLPPHKVEWPLPSVPQEIWALLHQWEMSLRGGPADALMPVSGVPWASNQRGAEWCWPETQQDWKVWANEAIWSHLSGHSSPGPAPALFRGCFGSSFAELTHIPESPPACRQGCTFC